MKPGEYLKGFQDTQQIIYAINVMDVKKRCSDCSGIECTVYHINKIEICLLEMNRGKDFPLKSTILRFYEDANNTWTVQK